MEVKAGMKIDPARDVWFIVTSHNYAQDTSSSSAFYVVSGYFGTIFPSCLRSSSVVSNVGRKS